MNVAQEIKLRTILEEVVSSQSRINEAKPTRYWYPLSLATYGVDEIIGALDSMCRFRTSMAEKTQLFERHFSHWQGARDAVMVNSGSSADLLLCMLLTNPLHPLVEPDSEIIVPVVTWPTQIWSAMMAGLRVKCVDVDPATLNIDYDDLERSMTSRTKAIFLVHLMGNPCDMDRVGEIAKRRGCHILEDCCEAMGAAWDGRKVGTFGLGGTFSFFFSHHITCMEGGMVSVATHEHADDLRVLRAHGWIRNVDPTRYPMADHPGIDPRYAFVNWGLNVRPTEVQAAFGSRQLEKADAFAARRSELADRIMGFLGESQWLRTPRVHPKATPSWLAIPILVSPDAPFTRDAMAAHLERNGVETRPVVTGNVARHPVAKLFKEFQGREFPGADHVHRQGFYIGLSPLQTDENVSQLLSVIGAFLAEY